MNLDDAIDAHIEWKVSLLQRVERGEALPDEAIVADDARCPLGQWLYDESASGRYWAYDCFAELLRSHAEFHRSAAEVLHCLRQGDMAAARRLMVPGGAFDIASRETINALMDLRLHAVTDQRAAIRAPSPGPK